MNLDMIGFIVGSIALVLALDKMMDVFFEKRRTPYVVLVLSYLPLLLPELLYGVLPETINTAAILFVPLFLFLIALNYEASMFKRVVAAVYIFFMFDIILVVAANFFVSHLPYFNNILEDSILHVIANFCTYLAAILIFRYFKYIRKNIFDFRAFFSLLIIMVAVFVTTGFYTSAVISRQVYFGLVSLLLAGSTLLTARSNM